LDEVQQSNPVKFQQVWGIVDKMDGWCNSNNIFETPPKLLQKAQ
jgi:hypothetical protein